MKKLPIGIQTFREIIEGNYYYADKTAFIQKLDNGKYYFLSRPRRFGKSLFLDTLKEAFLGNKELFKGLYLYDAWDWGKSYPVIKISFGSGAFGTPEDLQDTIEAMLDEIAEKQGIQLKRKQISLRFRELIVQLNEHYNEKVVVLIDEYDKPILDVIEQPEIAQKNREVLKNFYGVLKDADLYLKFVFLTGVTRFSKVSIFSGLNQLNDITLDESFSTICGYTQRDLQEVFAEPLIGRDVNKIKEWYNGYTWLGEPVYNPFDILLFIDKEYTFRNYWFSTGTPTFLLKLIEKNNYYIPDIEHCTKDEAILDSFDVDYIDVETLLWQTGYLTIDEAYETPRGMQYRLKIPNKEVTIALFGALANFISKIERPTIIQNALYDSLLHGDINNFEKQIQALFAAIPYNNFTGAKLYEYEGYYTSVFFAYLKSIGADVIGEDVTNKGRIDLTVKMPNGVVIFEFKTDGANALEQIKDRGYHQKYSGAYKDIYLVGIEFDVHQRNVVKVAWEKVA